MNRRAAIAALAGVVCSGCGYHVAGKADLMPKSIKTIAILPFDNNTVRPRLPQMLVSALSREFISRTRYQIIADQNEADAVLRGYVVNYNAFPTVFDPTSGRSSGVQVQVQLAVSLQDRKTGEMLFNRPSLQFRERYEISISETAYFDESAAALDRLSRDVARMVVSSILERF